MFMMYPGIRAWPYSLQVLLFLPTDWATMALPTAGGASGIVAPKKKDHSSLSIK